jgi:hypothetical protein
MMRDLSMDRGRAPVIKISLPFVYDLANELEPITAIKAGENMLSHFVTLWRAKFMIETLLMNSVFASTLRVCREGGNGFVTTLNSFINKGTEDSDAVFAVYDTLLLSNQFAQFKSALLAELGVVPSYFVNQKGGFDTLTLLEWGHLLFPNDLQSKVPEAIFDTQEATKALAFELPTSAGFHVFRATESVLRRYYAHTTNGSPPPKVRSIAVYVRQLRIAKCGDEIILTTLEQMAKLHRNPLVHPEVVLTMDEAISTIGIARSAVTTMLQVLPVLAPTTGSL